ncbi:putative membrane protein [Burkholderiales bacterium JOSHI_001]|nr:putative membrane protein [Burkholderiales bacterium JOSHI_001]
MNQVVNMNEREDGLRTVGHISYLLHTIVAVGAVLPGAQASTLLLIIAFVLDLVKKGDAAGTWQESHFSWRIRTVVIAAILYAVTAPLWLLLIAPGWIAWGIVSIWFLYRVVRGWVNLNGGRAMPA